MSIDTTLAPWDSNNFLESKPDSAVQHNVALSHKPAVRDDSEAGEQIQELVKPPLEHSTTCPLAYIEKKPKLRLPEELNEVHLLTRCCGYSRPEETEYRDGETEKMISPMPVSSEAAGRGSYHVSRLPITDLILLTYVKAYDPSPMTDSYTPYASHVVLAEQLLEVRRNGRRSLSSDLWAVETYGLLEKPSLETPLERALMPNCVEDANNLYAKILMAESEPNCEGLSIAESRQVVAEALVRETQRNACSGNFDASRRVPQPDGESLSECKIAFISGNPNLGGRRSCEKRRESC